MVRVKLAARVDPYTTVAVPVNVHDEPCGAQTAGRLGYVVVAEAIAKLSQGRKTSKELSWITVPFVFI